MIDSIYSLFIEELNFIEENSYFASQSMRNQDECGELVELAIRRFLKEVIGERFKITHGYIYSAENRILSPQIDIIITDRLVPHKLKKFEYLDNLEIVPVESVVAIFEVKRTLNNTSLKKAKEQLERIFNVVSLSKTNSTRYMQGGSTMIAGQNIQITGGLLSNPLIGIIGLLHEGIDNFNDFPWFMDTLFSFQGKLIAPKDPVNENISSIQQRFDENPIGYMVYDNEGKIKALKGFIAYLISYLNGVSGRIFDINSYLC